jgi:DNA-binding transcriptional regulator YiaG
MDTGVGKSMLERAMEQLGAADLAQRLGVTEETLRAWRAGHATMPQRKAMLLVDLIDEISNP